MKKMRKGIFLLLTLLFLFSTSSQRSLASSGVSLKVAPLFFNLNINPGEEKIGQIYVENDAENDTDVSVSFSDFFIDGHGEYIFSEGKDILNPELKPYLMKDWFTTDSQSFALKAGEGRTVKYTITVPKDVELGGHYGAIFFKTACQLVDDKAVIYSDKSSLCVSGRVGTLFLVAVGGAGVRSGKIERVDAPRITFADKADFSVTIKNTGNTHFKPEGSVDVKSVFGTEILRLEVKDKTLLPNNEYAFGGQILRNNGLGLYNINGSIRDGDGQEMKFQKWVIILPWKELLPLLLFISLSYWFSRRFEVRKYRKDK